MSDKDLKKLDSDIPESVEVHQGSVLHDNVDGLHRRLSNRQIQLLAIGGCIGTALFVSIGNGLAAAGPGSLFIAYALYSCILAMVNNSISEMITLYPVSGGFIRLAGHFVDDALGFSVGYNFFFYEAISIPFEITAINLVLSYWRDDIPIAAICSVCIVLFFSLNVFAVRLYGEAEFWLSSGKVILIFLLFAFTFVTMVGGNPQHDAYGFRYWKNPGAFAEHHDTGDLGRFEGFLAALWSASFTVVGPEFIALAAAETKRPRIYVKAAFRTVYYRFILFFVLGALCVGIVCPWNNPTLQDIQQGKSSAAGAAASPYVIAMQNLGIEGLPHLVNALLITSIFSAGNTYTYTSSRTLYALALDGRAPAFLTRTTKDGVPIYALCVAMLFPFLSFLQASGNSATVLSWIISLLTAGGLINYLVMSITYINFYRACKTQGLDRRGLPYFGRFQPYCAYFSAVAMSLVLLFYGYSVFDPWSVDGFFQNYTMQVVAPILYVGWKIVKRTKIKSPENIDLTWERPIIDAYEADFTEKPVGFWYEMGQMIGIKRKKNVDVRFSGRNSQM